MEHPLEDAKEMIYVRTQKGRKHRLKVAAALKGMTLQEAIGEAIDDWYEKVVANSPGEGCEQGETDRDK